MALILSAGPFQIPDCGVDLRAGAGYVCILDAVGTVIFILPPPN
jgi:hypothetical protein